ncbi:MAG: hypothetical protein ACHP7A_04330 [Caulobacterales bacterium]|jgi:hypothetical protein
MDDTERQATQAIEAMQRISAASAEFEAAGAPPQAARVLAFDLKLAGLQELRALPWDDGEGVLGLASRLRGAPGCGPATTEAICALHASQS